MKKLLALLLCVMLLVSVVPTSAFAAEISGSAIDLSPAYEARNTLFAAYGLLGAAVAAKNTVLGSGDSMDLFVPKILEYLPSVLAGMGYGEDIPYILSTFSMMTTYAREGLGEDIVEDVLEDFLADYPSGVSMETLFKIFGSYATQLYNEVGAFLGVGSTELAIDNQIVGVYNDLNGIFTEFGLEPVAAVPISEPIVLNMFD